MNCRFDSERRMTKMHAFFFLFFSLPFLVSSASSASIYLRDLVAAAPPKSTISLESIVYSGPSNCNLNIDKDLTIVSPSSQAILDCGLTSRCLTVSRGASVTIIGLIFRNGNSLPLAPRAVERLENRVGPFLFFFIRKTKFTTFPSRNILFAAKLEKIQGDCFWLRLNWMRMGVSCNERFLITKNSEQVRTSNVVPSPQILRLSRLNLCFPLCGPLRQTELEAVYGCASPQFSFGG